MLDILVDLGLFFDNYSIKLVKGLSSKVRLVETYLRHHDRLEDIINSDEKDELYEMALKIVQTEKKASTSFLQRKLQIGYNRAARIIEQMEEKGIVTKANHVGKREFL